MVGPDTPELAPGSGFIDRLYTADGYSYRQSLHENK